MYKNIIHSIFKSYKFIYPTTQTARKNYSFLVSDSVILMCLHRGSEERKFRECFSLFVPIPLVQPGLKGPPTCGPWPSATSWSIPWRGSLGPFITDGSILAEAVSPLWRCSWPSTWPHPSSRRQPLSSGSFPEPLGLVRLQAVLGVREFQDPFLFQQSLTRRLSLGWVSKTWRTPLGIQHPLPPRVPPTGSVDGSFQATWFTEHDNTSGNILLKL